jgi:hypothetical protein
MTQKEVQALRVGQSVGYQPSANREIIDAIVLSNGPRLDENKKPIPHLDDVLVIQLESGPTTVSWEPVNYPEGITQLVAKT